tara:strand:- start:195 stop:563 length:369 start_codon:yes stop_codon:yes gene_type:complete
MDEKTKESLYAKFKKGYERTFEYENPEEVVSFISMWGRIELKIEAMSVWDNEELLENEALLDEVIIDTVDSTGSSSQGTKLKMVRNWMATEALVELTLQETSFYICILHMLYNDEIVKRGNK